MNSGMQFPLPNPTHMTPQGLWIHRDIRGAEHVPDAGCWCCPLFVAAEQMNEEGPRFEEVVALNRRH